MSWIEKLWISDRQVFSDFKKLADAYLAVLEEHGWLDDWNRFGDYSLNLVELAKKMNMSLKDAVKIVQKLSGFVTYTYYFIYEDKRAHSVSIPKHVIREVCKFLRRKINRVARINPAAAQRLQEKYLPRFCLLLQIR